MVKVLAMMNAPTNRLIAANTSRNVVMNPSAVPICSVISSLSSSWVTASAPRGNTGVSRSRRTSGDVPWSALTEKLGTAPSGENTARALASSSTTRVAPARGPSKETSPTMVTRRGSDPTNA